MDLELGSRPRQSAFNASIRAGEHFKYDGGAGAAHHFPAPSRMFDREGPALHDSRRFVVQEVQARHCLLFLVPARGSQESGKQTIPQLLILHRSSFAPDPSIWRS